MRWLSLVHRLILGYQLAFVCRLVLGGFFLIAGLAKVGNPAGMYQSVLTFKILPDLLARPFAFTLPWLEIITGGFLILGLMVPSASALLVLLNAAFLIAIGVNLGRGSEIDCGCFGTGEPLSRWVFVRDVGLLFMSTQILFAKPGFLTLRSGISALRRMRRRS